MFSILLLICTFLVYNVIFVSSQSDGAMMGPGKWIIEDMDECGKEMPMMIKLSLKTLNRTHYGCDLTLDATEEITGFFGAIIYVCKHVDGGCKDYQTITDDSMERLAIKYVPEMFVDILMKMGIQSGEMPIPKGEHTLSDYVLDQCMFPEECVYGKFTALVYLMKGSTEMACLKITIEFVDDESPCPSGED